MDDERLTRLLGPESAKLVSETMKSWGSNSRDNVLIDRARFERLRVIASIFQNNVDPAQAATMLQPGDLDPIP